MGGRSRRSEKATSSEITQLLHEWRGGNARALDRLIPLVYDELRRVAARAMRGERVDHTLQATALVHEAYARLIESEIDWKSRAQFFSIAARAMRRILVDHARARSAAKRGGGAAKVPLENLTLASHEDPASFLELDDALTRLATLDSRQARAVELHFFAGLSYEETARALDVSTSTVHRDLKLARAWLHRELRGGADN